MSRYTGDCEDGIDEKGWDAAMDDVDCNVRPNDPAPCPEPELRPHMEAKVVHMRKWRSNVGLPPR